MSDTENCYEKLKKEILNNLYLFLGGILIAGFALIITVIVAGQVITYNKLKAKIYHTHFMEREITEKLYDAEISLDSSTGHMIVEKKVLK